MLIVLFVELTFCHYSSEVDMRLLLVVWNVICRQLMSNHSYDALTDLQAKLSVEISICFSAILSCLVLKA